MQARIAIMPSRLTHGSLGLRGSACNATSTPSENKSPSESPLCGSVYLVLPPYWKEPYDDFACVYENAPFHDTIEGQKFLLTAVLNGVFGFCPNCKIVPLIPRGTNYKPAHSSAAAGCIKCGYEEDLDRFDGVSFTDYPELKERVKNKIKERFQIDF